MCIKEVKGYTDLVFVTFKVTYLLFQLIKAVMDRNINIVKNT